MLSLASGGASLISRSRKEACEEAIRTAIREAVQKTAESVLSQFQGGVKDTVINNVMNEITKNPDSFILNFSVIDEQEDMVMNEVWVTVEAEVDEEKLKVFLQIRHE